MYWRNLNFLVDVDIKLRRRDQSSKSHESVPISAFSSEEVIKSLSEVQIKKLKSESMNFQLSMSVTMRRKNSKILLEGMLLLLVFEARGELQQFSTQKMRSSNHLPVIDRVPACERRTFCEVTWDYPMDIVNNALKKNPHLQNFANGDEMDIRTDEGPEEEPLCLSTEQIVFPKSGLTKSKKWKYIVNHQNLTQSVRIETCLEEEKPCRVIEGFAEGYVTTCKQKYIYRQLFAVGEDGSIIRESFRFPASCCCRIEFQGDKFLKSYGYED